MPTLQIRTLRSKAVNNLRPHSSEVAEPRLCDVQVLWVIHASAYHFYLSLIKVHRWAQTEVAQHMLEEHSASKAFSLLSYFYKSGFGRT